MEPDHYATLGVSPRATDAAIHAAYRSLIRRYHPDRNASVAAAGRAQQINSAYAILGNPQRRADYDAYRRAWRQGAFRHTGPFAATALSAVAAGLLLFALFDKPADADRSAPQPAASVAAPVEAPVFSVAPSSAVPEAAVPGQRAWRTLPQAASAKSIPPVRMPSDAPHRQAEPAAPPASDRQVARSETVATAEPSAPVATTPTAAALGPSFDCNSAAGRAEQRICGSAELAFLDRRHAFFQGQSLGKADEARRAQLLSTGEAFVSRRDRCRTSACISAAYLQRLREISDIMQRSPPSP